MPTEDPLIIIQDEPKKFHFKTKDNQRVNIEHRNNQIVLTLCKWGEEAFLEVALSVALSNKIEFLENRIELETSAIKLIVYPLDTRSTSDFYGDTTNVVQCHDGGLRFELVLKVKPPVNSFTVPIAAKNLRFSYQPFLTQEDIDAGRSCPLNVEGSYAVYHISKRNNQYMTGKAFHIFRPIAEDAVGSKAWCSIEIDAYLNPTSLTLTIPQQFLDEAVYPVTIDPDFGYQAVGGNWNLIAAWEAQTMRVGSAWAMPAPGGTANWIKAYVRGSLNAVDCKAFINQKDSGGAGTHAQIATDEELACPMGAHWEQFTLAGEALTQGVVYILNVVGDGADVTKGQSYDLAYDKDGATAIASYDEAHNYGAPESPWLVAAMGTTWDHSIYCNYTEVGIDPPTVTTQDATGKGQGDPP